MNLGHHRILGAGALLLSVVIAGCSGASAGWTPDPGNPAFGRVGSAADAVAAARILTSLEEPIAIVGEPRYGRAADLYPDNPAGGFTDEAARDFAVRQGRTAWRVDLSGRYAAGGCGEQVCPLVSATHLLVIDEETGTLLFGNLGVGP
jgi:hypothetical protein